MAIKIVDAVYIIDNTNKNNKTIIVFRSNKLIYMRDIPFWFKPILEILCDKQEIDKYKSQIKNTTPD